VEPGWFCTLALKSKPPDFFAKIIFGFAIRHFITKQVGKNETLHCLGASGIFRAASFHVGVKSDVTNSKKCETFAQRHFM
jgi:hypothetical protein